MLLATWAAGDGGVVLLPVLRLFASCTAGEGGAVSLLPAFPLPLAILFASCTAGGGGVLPAPLPPLVLPVPLVLLPVAMLLASCTEGGGTSPFAGFFELLRLRGLLLSAGSPA